MANPRCHSTIHFRFKGSRKYVQGPDIFNELSGLLEKKYCLHLQSLKFVKPLKVDALVYFAESNDSLETDIHSAMGSALDSTGHKVPIGLIPLNDSPILQSYEYDEEHIVNLAIATNNMSLITLNQSTHYTLIEEAVALIKYHHNQTMPSAEKKWLFCAIEVASEALPLPYIRLGQRLKIVPNKILAKRYSKNNIYLDDKLVAVIDFTLGNP